MKSLKMKFAALAIASVAIVMGTSGVASAQTVWGPGTSGQATASRSGYTVSGTVYDTKADGYCVRVYTRGKNLVTGSVSGWAYEGQACGYATGTNFSDRYVYRSDRFSLKVCQGMPNSSSSNCVVGAWF